MPSKGATIFVLSNLGEVTIMCLKFLPSGDGCKDFTVRFPMVECLKLLQYSFVWWIVLKLYTLVLSGVFVKPPPSAVVTSDTFNSWIRRMF